MSRSFAEAEDERGGARTVGDEVVEIACLAWEGIVRREEKEDGDGFLGLSYTEVERR